MELKAKTKGGIMIEKIQKILTSEKVGYIVIGLIAGIMLEGISLYAQGYVVLP